MASQEPRVTIQVVNTRLVLVEYKLDRLYWAVNGVLVILATSIIGAAATWMLNGGFVHFPAAAGRDRSAMVLSMPAAQFKNDSTVSDD